MKRKQGIELGTPAFKRQKSSCVVIAIDSKEVPNESDQVLYPLKSVELLKLNYYCLTEIVSYLSNTDLINLCMADDYFKDTIRNCDFRGRLFDFTELVGCHILMAFEIFGQHMTNIKISEREIRHEVDGMSEFDEILRLISTYCSLDTIKHLDIEFYLTTRIKKRSIYNSVPFFRRLESLKISEVSVDGSEICVDYFYESKKYNKSVDDLIERVLMHALNINSISMNCIKISGRFLHLQLVNLKKLQFIRCNIRDSLALASFLKSKPELVQFTWIDSSIRGMDNSDECSSAWMFEHATSNLTSLETFEYHPDEIYITNSNKIEWHHRLHQPNVQLLEKFKKLKKLAITGISNCWPILSKMNTLEMVADVPHVLYYPEYIRRDIKFNRYVDVRKENAFEFFRCGH